MKRRSYSLLQNCISCTRSFHFLRASTNPRHAHKVEPRQVPTVMSKAYDIGRSDNGLSALKTLSLFCVAFAAIASREFAVVRFESIIHEFDPHFNFRATKVLTQKGVYEFWNWFDPTAWYPLGRVAGGTLYPGLMLTSGFIHNVLHYLHLPVNIREICVLLAPGFSGLTAIATFLLTKEIGSDENGKGGDGAGLWAALFIGITPG